MQEVVETKDVTKEKNVVIGISGASRMLHITRRRYRSRFGAEFWLPVVIP